LPILGLFPNYSNAQPIKTTTFNILLEFYIAYGKLPEALGVAL
jgi:hypothetical protein